MTRRERLFLLAGLVPGLCAAVLIYALGGGWEARHKSAESLAAGPQVTAASKPAQEAETQKTVAPATAKRQASYEETLTLQLSDEEQQAIEVQTAEVRPRKIARPILAVGKVDEAETRLSAISARVGGRIDRLLVDYTGQQVLRGQSVALIYSPELVSGAEEYKLALENRAHLGPTALAEAVAQADELVASAKRRLELWGLTKTQIQEIESSAQPNIDIAMYSPARGVVTERKVTEGQYVKEGDVLYIVADLSTVWVKAEVYESDLPLVRIGQAVEITSEAFPATPLRGRVSFIEPQVNQQTRTLAVRIEVSNPQLRLRPGMFTHAKFLASTDRPILAVPRSAVLDTGTQRIVYVAMGNGLFERRPVELGPAGEEYYPVLSGLKEGERVVIHGNFLIDSQTRITGGMTGLFGGSKEFTREAQPVQPTSYKITFRPDPDPPRGAAENAFHVLLLDANGKPVSDAQVKVTLVMPAMPTMGMPEMRASADLSWTGSEYTGKTTVPMAGPWTVTIEASRGGQLLASHRISVNAR